MQDTATLRPVDVNVNQSKTLVCIFNKLERPFLTHLISSMLKVQKLNNI